MLPGVSQRCASDLKPSAPSRRESPRAASGPEAPRSPWSSRGDEPIARLGFCQFCRWLARLTLWRTAGVGETKPNRPRS